MKNQRQQIGSSGLAWLLLILFSWSVFQPAISYAGGPTQPEASSFTPIGVTDMVDPFTGDFKYNIPLMDIEGYPINIAYNSGVTMDQEASWVGLGWNLNAGAITRSLRGVPDDFSGDLVQKEQNTKPSFNLSVDAGLSGEVFGFELGNLTGSLSLNAGLSFNNYTGFGSSISIGPSFDLGKHLGGELSAGFSLSGSSENGASFAPNISLSYTENVSKYRDIKRTGTIGTAFNSRAGLQSLTYGFSQSNVKYAAKRNTFLGLFSYYTRGKASSQTASLGGSFDMGLSEYLPTPQHPKIGGSVSLNVNAAITVFSADAQGNIGVSVSRSWIPNDKKVLNVPSFGYMYQENGQRSTSNQLDFNRDNDQPFSKYSVNLPSAFQTYDIFSVQAQGTGGSFRPQRNEVSYVYDPQSNIFDVGVSGGVELGFGNLTDIGVDIQVPITTTYSGIWSESNFARQGLSAKPSHDIVNSYSFVEASESSVQTDDIMVDQFNGSNPERFVLEGSDLFPRVASKLNQNGNIVSLTRNTRLKRELTNNQLYILTRSEVASGMGVMPLDPLISGDAQGHHISEITQLGTDGRRYVFGLPAYNNFQEDVTFAIGDGMYTNDGIDYAEDNSGVITYTSGNDPSSANTRGIDNYYNSTRTPAYAHSYMLSAVLSDDYIDADSDPGPSKNDLGSYVKFSYNKVSAHQWRSPMASMSAYFNEGMRSDKTDDKASFTYGQKDLYYLSIVETKNYVAVFKTENRKDGRSASGRDGDFDGSAMHDTQLLRSITLYTRSEYEANIGNLSNAVPLQEVRFDYDYSLCRKYPGNSENGSSDLTKGGKLTLTGIVITYQNSGKMESRGYHFNYSTKNPEYNLKGSDRWGTFKTPVTGSETNMSTELNNSEYPYSENDKTKADLEASAWALTNIQLPSGGEISVTYEADDYQYVQHKKASQMFKIVGSWFGGSSFDVQTSRSSVNFMSLVSGSNKNPYLLFDLENQSDDVNKYVSKNQQLYFRVLTELDPTGSNFKEKTEFISGYGIVSDVKKILNTNDNRYYGAIKLEGEKLLDAGSADYSPVIKQAILFGRTQLPRTITQDPGTTLSMPGSEPSGEQAILDVVNAMVEAVQSFKELATGPNKFIYDQGKAQRFVPLSSWMRLNCPSGHKIGGGSRVSQIEIKDNWDMMGGAQSSGYGQKFTYTLEDGTSSGVASYEPQLGGDENTWHSAYIINKKKRLAMDDKMYIEDPIMESQFPSPSVGYSRVVITDLHSDELGVHGTGKVVKEFYTAKDFPTIVKATNVDILPKNSFLPLLPKYQYLTANQGFSIELNDMHGKPKKESVYGQDQTAPLSTVEYMYKSQELGLGGVENKRLTNEITVINPDGSVSQKTVGVRYDMVADFRESKTVSQVPKFHVNTNSFFVSIIPIFAPTFYPGYDRTTNRFRSATMNKTIQKFGILDKTVANQDGSIVETNNLAYDSQTGQVLVTQTTTDFNDKVYSLNYPAYWKYPAFGQASKNIAYSYKTNSISTNGFSAVPANLNYFSEGDEVSVSFSSYTVKAWVVEKNVNGIRMEDKSGQPVSGGQAVIKVIRSGYKNKQETSMASMTSRNNPVSSVATNQFSNVLNAGAVEFGQDWKTYCDCFTGGTTSNNPYVLGIKGNWRPIRSYTYLSGRVQTNYDNNTNIRKDGVFTSYSPFYKLNQGSWTKDGLNWTFVSEVTQFSPNGMTLETKDALGRYSSSLFGFNNTLTTAVAANSRMQQIATGSFEDLGYNSCTEQGYFGKAAIGTGSQGDIPAASISTDESHTGRTSIKVTPASKVTFQNIISTCDYEETCNLELQCWHQLTNCQFIKIVSGTAPYNLEYEAVGNANAELAPNNTIGLNLDTTSDATSLLVKVTDANGCMAGVKLTVKNGIIYYEYIQF